MENQITSLDVNEGRKVVPYDKDRKTITFYDTFVDMNGDVVKYDDIAVVQSAALNSSSMIYFYFSNSFTYNFCFTTYDGVKHNFKRHGYQAYGIGNYRRIKREFDVVAQPMYDIVFKKVADRLLDRIINGATVNICGLQISRDHVIFEKKKEIAAMVRGQLSVMYLSPAARDNWVCSYFIICALPAFSGAVWSKPSSKIYKFSVPIFFP